MKVYFFSGPYYTLYTRGETGAGTPDPGFKTPQPVSQWGWPRFENSDQHFGADGIDAALYSGSKCYFFKGKYYVRVTRHETTGFGTQDFQHPRLISQDWGFRGNFGADGIDAALWSGPVTYFFKGSHYIRVTRGETDFGNGGDPGYPKTIAGGWGWPVPFANGVKGALPSGEKCYFFSGTEHIRVSRGLELGGFIDKTYPASIARCAWPTEFGFGAHGIDAALYSGGDLQPEPSGGLEGNVNYWLADNGNKLTGVSVTINIDNDVISTSDGFGFQLNAMSQTIPNTLSAVIQQLIIYSPRNTNELTARIFIYSSNGGANPFPLQISLDEQTTITTLPGVNHIQAGASVQFQVQNDPSTGKVTGCVFAYTPANGSTASTHINISDGTIQQTGRKATLAYMQPIDTFTMDIVADFSINGGPTGVAKLTEAEGTISYAAASAPQGLTAYTSVPPFSNVVSITEETADIVYAGLPGNRPIDVSQLWGMTPPVPVDLEAAEETRQIVLHALPPPRHLQDADQRPKFQHALPPPAR